MITLTATLIIGGIDLSATLWVVEHHCGVCVESKLHDYHSAALKRADQNMINPVKTALTQQTQNICITSAK